MGKKEKYYAVKIGRVPGVYNNWEDCEINTKGYSGALHKAFSEEAEAWKYVGVKFTAPTPTLAPRVSASTPEKEEKKSVGKRPVATVEKPSADILSLRRQPISYTMDQKSALRGVTEFLTDKTRREFVLTGYAGTGKTTLIENIASFIRKQGRECLLAAPTNRAVKVLGDKVPADFDRRTLHATLYGAPDEKGKWIPRVDFESNQVLVADEASMISSQVYQDLIAKIKAAGAKVIFIGDSYQLRPVGEDSKILTHSQVSMKQVMRQSAESNILTLATLIRTLEQKILPGDSAADVQIRTKEIAMEEFFRDVKQERECVFICAKNDTRCQINRSSRRERFGPEVGDEPGIGDHLISIANGPNVNGEVFCITERSKGVEPVTIGLLCKETETGREIVNENAMLAYINDHPTIFFPWTIRPSIYHGQIIADKKIFDPAFLTKNHKSGKTEIGKNVNIVTYAYAITAHKSQGGQWEKVYVLQDAFLNDPRWFYTAITRAKKELVLVKSFDCPQMTWAQIRQAIV